MPGPGPGPGPRSRKSSSGSGSEGEGEKEGKKSGLFLPVNLQASSRMYGYTAATTPLRSSAGEVSNEQVGSGDVQSAGDKTGWAGGAGLNWIGGGVQGREWQRRDTGL